MVVDASGQHRTGGRVRGAGTYHASSRSCGSPVTKAWKELCERLHDRNRLGSMSRAAGSGLHHQSHISVHIIIPATYLSLLQLLWLGSSSQGTMTSVLAGGAKVHEAARTVRNTYMIFISIN